VTIDTWEATGHFFSPTSIAADILKPRPCPGHALTGPIAVRGARRGDTLVVEIQDVRPNTWGWTAFGPGRGLLPDDFTAPHLRVWDLSDGQTAQGLAGVQVPLAPFCGVLGVALAEPGTHNTIPPRRVAATWTYARSPRGPACICRSKWTRLYFR
jgi:acetamidase/formamidase